MAGRPRIKTRRCRKCNKLFKTTELRSHHESRVCKLGKVFNVSKLEYKLLEVIREMIRQEVSSQLDPPKPGRKRNIKDVSNSYNINNSKRIKLDCERDSRD